ncbi:hypothetical protein KKA13_00885 [Patescibacteria group bacterium]|nr:hypothetical protein [Patescibacteria group bacterium]MBU1612934.1 hypothetical protein [Patescibacteria group bacterium]
MSFEKKIHLKGGEEIKQIIRQYPPTYFWRYLSGIIFLFAISFFMFWLISRGWWGQVAYGVGMFIGLYIIVQTWFFANANVLIITNERVVDINRMGWFDEVMSSAGYLDLKDVFVRKKGMMGNVFNFGTLTVETKSQQVVLEFEKIHQPQKWQNLILELRDSYRRNRHLSGKREIYESFIKIIPQLSEEDLCEIYDLISAKLATINANNKSDQAV